MIVFVMQSRFFRAMPSDVRKGSAFQVLKIVADKLFAALPPDVRKGSAFPLNLTKL